MQILNAKQIEHYTDNKMNKVDLRLKDWIQHNDEHKLAPKRSYFSHNANDVNKMLNDLSHNLKHGKYLSIPNYNAHATLSNILDGKRQYSIWKHKAKLHPKMRAFKYDLDSGVLTNQKVFKTPQAFHNYSNKEKTLKARYDHGLKRYEAHHLQNIKHHDLDYNKPTSTQIKHLHNELIKSVLSGDSERVSLYLNINPKICQKLHIMTGKQGNKILATHHAKPVFYNNNVYHTDGKHEGKIIKYSELGKIVDNYQRRNPRIQAHQSIQDSINKNLDKMFGINIHKTSKAKLMHNRGISR